MTHTTHPTKELVREYLDRRAVAQTPPPTAEEIRRQLGWDLVREIDRKRQECHR